MEPKDQKDLQVKMELKDLKGQQDHRDLKDHNV